MKKRLLALFICMIMTCELALSVSVDAMASTVSSSEKVGEYYKSITIKPENYTFYDVGEGISQSVDKAFIYKTVKEKLLPDWSRIAEGIYRIENETTFLYSNFSDYHSTNYKEAFIEANENSSHACYSNVRKGLMADKGHEGERRDDYFGTTGLSVAGSLNEVRDRIAEDLYYGLKRESCSKKYFLNWKTDNDKLVLPELADTTNQYVVYSIVTPIRNRAKAYTYNTYGICFYDFELDPINADGIEYYSPATPYGGSITQAYKAAAPGIKLDDKDAGYTLSAQVKNATTETTGYSVKSGYSGKYTTETSFSKTEGIQTGTSVAMKVNFGVKSDKGPSGEIEMSSQYSVVKSQSSTEGSRYSYGEDIENTVSTEGELPPHTALMVQNSNGKKVIDMDFNTPAELRYKVAIFSTSADLYADNWLACFFGTARYEQKYFITTFGTGELSNDGSAAKDMNQRFVVGADGTLTVPEIDNPAAYGTTHRYRIQHGSHVPITDETNRGGADAIDWKTISEYGADYKNAIENVKKIPMVSSIGSAKVTVNAITSEVKDVMPLYPLSSIKIVNKSDESIAIAANESIDLTKEIEIKGIDSKGCTYYGFNSNDGEWYQCDYFGREIDKGSDSGVVEIFTDYWGHSYLEGLKTGETYVRWRLKNKVQYTNVEAPVKTVDSSTDLNAPIVKVTVKKYDGEITVDSRPVKLTKEELKNNAVTVKPIHVWGAQGELAYEKISGNSVLSLNTSTGAITIARGTAAGQYTIKVRVKDLETAESARVTAETEVSVTVQKDNQVIDISDDVIIIDHAKTKAGNVTSDPVEVFGRKGISEVQFEKISGNSNLRIDSSTGAITALKGIAAGDYDLKIMVTVLDKSGEYNTGTAVRVIPVTVIDLSKTSMSDDN